MVQTWLMALKAAWEAQDPVQFTALFAQGSEYRDTPISEPIPFAAFPQFWSDLATEQHDNDMQFERVEVSAGNRAIAFWRAFPHYAMQALRDPDGANLGRLQMVKVWAGGEAIIDVAVSDDRKPGVAIKSTVDLANGTYDTSVGAAELIALWRDPDFDPAQGVSYYLRALEIPTPGWSTILAAKWGLPLSPHVPQLVQSRAWTSPISILPAIGPLS